MAVTRAAAGAWEQAQPGEREFWELGDWQRASKEQRAWEWSRHLADLGLDTTSFRRQSVLDVGCGPTSLAYFIDAGRAVGLDPLAAIYERWNGFYGRAIELVEGRGEAMPFHDAEFDAVFCINVLDHAEDAAQVMGEITRVLRPGGLLVAMVDLDSPLRRLHKRVRPHVGRMHPLSLSYDWLRSQLADYEMLAETRDRETFTARWRNMRYEAFWDGLVYRATRSPRWMHHVWLAARH